MKIKHSDSLNGQICLLVLFFLILIISENLFTVRVKAANKQMVKLYEGRTYDKYDITGDGKADKIRVNQSEYDKSYGTYSQFNIYINGKKAYHFTDNDFGFFSSSILLLKIKGKKSLLDITLHSIDEGEPLSGIFEFRNGRLIRLLNLTAPVYRYGWGQSGKVQKVYGKKITIRYSVMSYAAGNISFDYVYRYIGKKLSLVSKIGKITKGGRPAKQKYYTLMYKVNYYSSVKAKKKKGTLKPGNKLIITDCYTDKTKVMLKVKTLTGKKVWIKSPTKQVTGYSNGKYTYSLFKEGMYTG